MTGQTETPDTHAALVKAKDLLWAEVKHLAPSQRDAFDRAIASVSTATSREELERLTVETAPQTNERPFDPAALQELVLVIGVVWSATRTLMMMSKKFVDGKDPGNPLVDLTTQLKEAGVSPANAADVATRLAPKLGALLAP